MRGEREGRGGVRDGMVGESKESKGEVHVISSAGTHILVPFGG
jgi:hypothetical protein